MLQNILKNLKDTSIIFKHIKYIEGIFSLNKIQMLIHKDTITEKFILLEVGDKL